MGGAISIFAIAILFSGWMYLAQPGMIFFPSSELIQSPNSWGLSYQDVSFKSSDDIELHGWYIPRDDSNQVLLFFHGNAGNISHRGESVEIFHRLGFNVFIIDYRGYGQSKGTPSEQGLYKDAAAAWQYLTQTLQVPEHNITLFGRSLGGSIAANLASNVHAKALIIESTFSSARDMATVTFPLLSHVIVMRFEFNTIDHVKNLDYPLLVIHSPDDDIIPYRLGKKIFEAAKGPKSFIDINGGHNGGFLQSQPQYQQQIAAFIHKIES